MSTATGFDAATRERFADLVVGFAANVQEGQIVAIGAELGKEEMVRALVASAYRRGARFVDVELLRPARQACAHRALAGGAPGLRALVAAASGCWSWGASAARGSA